MGVGHPGFCANSSTDWTTSLKKNPDTRGAAPSLLRILINLHHTARALARFLTTPDQSSSAAEITRPKYLKEVTISRGRPYALKDLDVTALSSYTASLRHFFSAPFLHCAVHRCVQFISRHVTSMSHRGHRGLGRGFPPPRSPWCPGRADAINAPTWMSASPPGCYTPQMGRASVPLFSGISS